MTNQLTHTVPSLQGTCRKRCKPTRKPNLRQEPFSPSRSNAGQRDSAAKINRLNNELKNGQLVTSGHKTLGAKWLFEPLFSHQRSVYLDSEVAPKPPTILYRQPLACIINSETENYGNNISLNSNINR